MIAASLNQRKRGQSKRHSESCQREDGDKSLPTCRSSPAGGNEVGVQRQDSGCFFWFGVSPLFSVRNVLTTQQQSRTFTVVSPAPGESCKPCVFPYPVDVAVEGRNKAVDSVLEAIPFSGKDEVEPREQGGIVSASTSSMTMGAMRLFSSVAYSTSQAQTSKQPNAGS